MTSEQLQDHHSKFHNTNWKHIKLDDIITLEYGKGLTKESRDNGEYPVYGSNGIVGYHSDFLIEGPTIIVGRKGTVGAISWSNYSCWPIDTTYYVKKKSSEIDDCWLYYKLKSLTLSKLNMATGIPGLNRDHVYSTNIQLPPLPEQHKIASILSKVDEHISHTEAIIEKTEELKKGLMQQLLTKGIGHTKFKKTEVGEIPEEWDVKKIDEVKGSKKNSIAMGPFGSNITVDNFVPTGVPVIRGLNLTHAYLVERDFVYISEKKANDLSASNAFPNDIVITHRGTVGQVSIIPHNSHFSRYVVSQSQMKLTCEKEIVSPYFVNFFLNSVIGQNLLLRNKSGTGVPAIGQPTTSLKRIPIPIPPLDEQNKIVKIIASVYDQLSQNQTYLSHLQELKKGLMQDLLTGKVRVTV